MFVRRLAARGNCCGHKRDARGPSAECPGKDEGEEAERTELSLRTRAVAQFLWEVGDCSLGQAFPRIPSRSEEQKEIFFMYCRFS